MFSSRRPAYRSLPIGSLGGRDKITSEVCLPHTTHDAQHTNSKKIYRAKHVLSSKVEGTPSTQGDGPKSVIPSECEGSKKDFSLRSK